MRAALNINRKILIALLMLFQFSPAEHLQLPQAPRASPLQQEKASNAISILLKQYQKSACDGEKLEIKCDDDYVIEIITAELTVLHNEQRNQRRPAWIAPPAGGTRMDPSLGNSSSDNQTTAGPVELGALCPLLDSDDVGHVQTGNETLQSERSPIVCNEIEAQEASSERKAKLLGLVRKQCSLLNSCSIDLRLAENGNHQLEASSASAAGNRSLWLGQFLGERCQRNRKLLELAYKCRPTKFRIKSACRQARLTLDCAESNKRLAIGAAHYGNLPDDKKTQDRCQLEEQRNVQATTTSTASMTMLGRPNCPIGTTSSSSTSPALGVLTRECLFKNQCQVQILPSVFASCDQQVVSSISSGQTVQAQTVDYLKVIYACVNKDYLVSTNLSLVQRLLLQTVREASATPSGGPRQEGEMSHSSSSFNSPNVSSSLLSSAQQQITLPPANINGGLFQHSLTGRPTSNPNDDTHDGEVTIQSLIEKEPDLNLTPPHLWTPLQRVKFVLLRFQSQLIAFAVITVTISSLVALFVRLVCARKPTTRVSKSSSSKSASTSQKPYGSSSSSSSSSSTSSSTPSSSSSTTNCTNQTNCTLTSQQPQSLASLGASVFEPNGLYNQHHLAAPNQNPLYKAQDQLKQLVHLMGPINHQRHHKQQPTNSCSESCFSLDDSQCPRQQQQQQAISTIYQAHHLGTPLDNNSPALQSNQTTPPIEVASLGNGCVHESQYHEQQQRQDWTSNTMTSGGARPKLWSFYPSEQSGNSMRLGGNLQSSHAHQVGLLQQQQIFNNAAATLRTQRQFSVQPQPVRNFECLRAAQQQPQQGSIQLEPHQSDYLLAMASINQQNQQQATAAAHPNDELANVATNCEWHAAWPLGVVESNDENQR